MPFEDEDGSLRDIADAIDMIERFTSGMGLEQFSEDPKTVAAVELGVTTSGPMGNTGIIVRRAKRKAVQIWPSAVP